MNESLQIIDSIQLIPIENYEISPLISKVKIKIFYLGENRNGSFIDKPTALSMAKTLRGCPIVGKYDKAKQDFTDHGEVITIDHNGIKTEIQTVPYGFIDLNASIGFEDYQEFDEKNRSVIRTYLVTEGFVWDGQYPELKLLFNDGGRPQSMELDEKTLKGEWTKINNNAPEIFIINDAIFSKLCILGEDVEPCFEGAAVTAPEVSSNFTKNDDFVKTLFTMMQELKELTFSLQNKGGTSMADVINTEFTEEQNAAPIVEEKETENFSIEEGKDNSETNVENDTNVEEFKKNDDEEAKDEENSDDVDAKEDDKDDEEDPKKNHSLEEKFALVEEELKELKSQYASLQEENKKLLDFQKTVEDEKKDALINSFYMLSDEDKKDVIENKTNYTLDEIEAKLSVICVRKKVNFNLDDENVNNNEEQPALIYNLNNAGNDDSLPAWLKAVEEKRNANN